MISFSYEATCKLDGTKVQGFGFAKDTFEAIRMLQSYGNYSDIYVSTLRTFKEDYHG